MCYSNQTSDITQGKPITKVGYINARSQSEVHTKIVQSTGGIRTNYQPDILPEKGLKDQQI